MKCPQCNYEIKQLNSYRCPRCHGSLLHSGGCTNCGKCKEKSLLSKWKDRGKKE